VDASRIVSFRGPLWKVGPCQAAWNVVDWRKVSVLFFSDALYLEPKFLRVVLLVFDYARSAEPLELLSHSHSTMLNGLSIASVLGIS
jgi:hypothetical protein